MTQTMMRLEFFSRRINTEGELGAHVRINIKSGSFRLSPTVVQEVGIKKGDKLNFSYPKDDEGKVDTVYMALEERGLTVGDGNTFSSTTHATDMRKAFENQIEEGHNVLILGVKLDEPVEAETDMGVITAFPLYFKSSQIVKSPVPRGTVGETEEDLQELPAEV